MEAFKYLPHAVALAINEAVSNGGIAFSEISEIRMRKSRQLSLSLDRVNMRVPYVCGPDDMEYTVDKLCRGSAYAYEHHLREGYIPAEGGMRVAVNTAVRYADGMLKREHIPDSIVFRIPIHTEGQTDRLANLMHDAPGGMLIFSPPAVGKTTALRDLVITLSGKAHSMRVAVIDSREEVDDGRFPECCLADVISGCERISGIEWALRTLSPQIIAVDELSDKDSLFVCKAAQCGVPVIATLHAACFEEVLSRTEIRDSFSRGAFSYLVRLSRKRGKAPEFEVHRFSEGRWSIC